ncbi:MAG: ABC transporter ATP-binding protein [Candidatus Hydrogenedentes bacterium]|nr:ABC transporter ATP-binding protein [Candidatus Hydrogenedentota bacterium]
MELALDCVRFAYPQGRFTLALDALHVAAGERIAIVGPSGSGKTTLLNLIAGIITPEQGAVRLGETVINTLSDASRRAFRIQHIGFVFQDFSLLDYLNVLQNILLPFRVNPVLTLDANVTERARRCADELGLAGKLDRPIQQLSQGERQRVALCRALVTAPRLLLADEPTGNLDPRTKQHAMEVLTAQRQQSGATLLMVTHDHSLLSGFDRVIDFATLAQEAD